MGLGPLDAALLLLAYVLGSIPFSYLIARRRGIDVRTVGSGNVGATNVLRTVGRGAGFAAFALDFLKGTAASAIALRAGGPALGAAAAVAAVLGHMYPVWLSFRGGKGVATGAGAFLPLIPVATAVGLLTFAGVAALTRYVSLGSVAGACALAASGFLLAPPSPAAWAAAFVAALIAWKHRANLQRIGTGTERRLGSRPAGAP